MIESSFIQSNCEKWSQTDPQKAVLLPYVDCSSLQFCQTDKGERNLCFENHGHKEFFHSSLGALEEAHHWFKNLALQQIPLIYVYGVGLGYYYQAAKAWLRGNPSHRLVFIEDNLAVIHRLFETEVGKELLHDPQVQLHYFEDMEKSQELFQRLYWNFFLTPLLVSGLHLYTHLKKTTYADLQHKIHYDASLKNSLLIEYLEYGVGFFKNFYPNLMHLEGAYLGDSLFGKFKNVPAIICGAGPSLEKNLPLLETIKNQALIFAGGSALNALNLKNIQPHFGAAIDPNPPQYERLSTNTAFEVPFFYRNRLYHSALKTIHGARLYITGSGGYDISSFFEERLDIQGELLEEGHNVVNFCLEVAHALGCNPIIFVGMDLAYTGEKAYASGVVNDNENTMDAHLISLKSQKDLDTLLRPGIDGKPVCTQWKWIAEAEWIGDFAKMHPEIHLVNATEGGLGFPGVVNQALQTVIEQYLIRDFDLSGLIHSEILNAALTQVTTEDIRSLMRQLLESLKRCIEDLTILMEETQVIQRRIQADRIVPFPLQTGKASLFENDLAEEPGYRYLLHIFNEAYTHVLNRELQALRMDPQGSTEEDQALGKLHLLIKRFSFLQAVAAVNIELIQKNLEMDISPLPVSEKPGQVEHTDEREGSCLNGDSVYRSQKQILSKFHYKNGMLEGPAETFYPSGQRHSAQQFNENLWEGDQHFYYPNGVHKTHLVYKKGQLIKAFLFNPDTTLKKTYEL